MAAVLAAAGAANADQYCNTGVITIPTVVGAATPYPSTITVSGAGVQITAITVNLKLMNHTYPDDLDILLVGPTGAKMILMSDCGGGTDLVNVNLTFDDAAAASLPDSTVITSGTYKPTNIGTGDTFPAPAPAGPYGSALSVFVGTNPNGVWSLYVYDDASGDGGNINGGWCLNITAFTPSTGACCFGETCAEGYTEADCIAASGEFMGVGSDCTPNPCIGACCFYPSGDCTDGLEQDCIDDGGTYMGDGTTCATVNCPTPGDNCNAPFVVNLPADLGLLFTDTTCDRVNDYANTCMDSYDGGEDMIFEVVVNEPICVNITLDANNIWGGMAIDDTCPLGPLTGDCIAKATTSADPDLITALNLAPGVYYLMVDVYPTPNCVDFTLLFTGCPGACCLPSGECAVLSPTECDSQGGAFQGYGVSCSPEGACCLPDNTCIITTEECCLAAGGEYLGDGSNCFVPSALYEETVNLPIPDNTPAGVSDTITVPDSFPLGDVNIDVEITHTWIGDLIITVTHNATTVTLWSLLCSSNDNMNVIFDDEGSAVVCATPTVGNILPFTGNFLSAFDGMDSSGDWTITVSDNAATDTGTLVRWSVHLYGQGNPCICGDLDWDADVDIDDYYLFRAALGHCLGQPEFDPDADYDGDGCVTFADYKAWILCYREVNGTLPPWLNKLGQTTVNPNGATPGTPGRAGRPGNP